MAYKGFYYQLRKRKEKSEPPDPGKEIAAMIKERKKYLGINQHNISDIDTELAQVFQLSPCTVNQWRRNVEDGAPHGQTGYIAAECHGQEHLNKLSLYLEFLHFDINDHVIAKAKEFDKRFVYPVEDSARFRIKSS